MLEWLSENMWVIWLVLAGGLAVSEMLTLDLTLLMLASGALAGAGVALVFPGLLVGQIVVAIMVALLMLYAVSYTHLDVYKRQERHRHGYLHCVRGQVVRDAVEGVRTHRDQIAHLLRGRLSPILDDRPRRGLSLIHI